MLGVINSSTVEKIIKTVMRILGEFLARDSLISALYAIGRPSVHLFVCLSVCPSDGCIIENGWSYDYELFTIW